MAHYRREHVMEEDFLSEDYADLGHFFHANSRAIENACSFERPRRAATVQTPETSGGKRAWGKLAHLNTYDAFEYYTWAQMKSLLASNGTSAATGGGDEVKAATFTEKLETPEEEEEEGNNNQGLENDENLHLDIEEEEQMEQHQEDNNGDDWELVNEENGGVHAAGRSGNNTKETATNDEEGDDDDDGGWILEGKSFLFAPFRAALMRGLRRTHEDDEESDFS